MRIFIIMIHIIFSYLRNILDKFVLNQELLNYI